MKLLSIDKVLDFESWDKITELSDFSYPWLTETLPKTIFKTYYDDSYLHFQFMAYGPTPLVYVKDNHKLEVINSERVEIFFRSDKKMLPYYCLEMDPNGRVLDYKANFYRDFDRDWAWPESLNIQTTKEVDHYTVQGKMSLSVLTQLGLLKNKQIETGIYRGHCVALEQNTADIKWISWINPNSPQPDFHVPSSFGLMTLN